MKEDSEGRRVPKRLGRPLLSPDNESPRGPSSCAVLLRIADRRRLVKSLKSIVRERCARRMEDWRVKEELGPLELPNIKVDLVDGGDWGRGLMEVQFA